MFCEKSNGVSQPELLKCPLCSDGRLFRGHKGLKIHNTRCHNPCAIQPNVSNIQSAAPSDVDLKTFESLITIYHRNIPLVKRIPRAARISLAKSLSIIVQKCFTNTDSAWQNLFTFSYKFFHVNKSTDGSLTTKLKQNCFSDSKIQFSKIRPPGYDFKKIVENKVMDGDIKNAARILFSSDTLAPTDDKTLEALIEKHPSHPLPSHNNANFPDNILQIKDEDTYDAIMSFTSGSAGGIDGITPQHLKDLVSASAGDAGRALLSDITKLCNFMFSGKVCSSFSPYLYGARLCAFNKKDGGIRPIAIGSTFRRLASKLACKHIVSTLKTKFQPLQVGFGSKGGCEAAVHATRTFLKDNEAEVLLKVDVKNAFNSLDRATLLNEVQSHLPQIFPYVWQSYSSTTKLMFDTHTINSSAGVQQGDPLGPALFCLGIHNCISNLKSKLNIWYLDDGTIGGKVNDVYEDFLTIRQQFEKIGLEINFSKCEVFFTDRLSKLNISSATELFNKISPTINYLHRNSLCLLGAPLFDEGIEPVLDNKIKLFLDNVDKLGHLNSHIAYTILKYCLFVPKLMYILRACPIWKFCGTIDKMDAALKFSLEKILNLSLDDNSWIQATLPIRNGGIGVRKISSVALPAFLASVHSVKDLCCLILKSSSFQITDATEAIENWKSKCPNDDIPKEVTIQKLWDTPLVHAAHTNLTQNLTSVTSRARLLALSAKESAHWLHALPSKNLGLLLDNESFRIAVGLRLGSPLCFEHRCPCGKEVDSFGLHGLSCPRSSGRLFRHGSLNDTIKRALATIDIPALIEPSGISRNDGKRPDGLTLVPWERGRALLWDATCVDTLAPSHVRETAVREGAAAEKAEFSKRRKYSSLVQNYIFVPFAVETLGPWSISAKKFLKDVTPRLVASTGDKRAGSFFAQRIGIAIQRGNAASILATIPRGHDLYTN